MTLAITIYIIVCVLSVIIFLLQQTETGGMGIISGASNSLLGATRTSFLAKIATFFAVLFFISALFLSILSSGKNTLFQNENISELLKPGNSEIYPNTQTNFNSNTPNDDINSLTPVEKSNNLEK